jgi:2-haloacid dehalogenase
MPLKTPPRGFLFDVFGTCVDWRLSVIRELIETSNSSLASSSAIPGSTRTTASRLTSEDWGRFAQEWRNTYKAFTTAIAADKTIPFKTVDQHHLDALQDLIKSWNLTGLWTTSEIERLSLVWHRLDPWPEAVAGIKALNAIAPTATLSNGNVGLLEDLRTHSGLEFTHLFSGEMWNSYKPDPKVYLGAVEKLSISPGEAVMVAAHLKDLQAAKSNGLQTIYVERPLEEDFSSDQVEQARAAGFVDIWVSLREDGFLAAAEKIGASVENMEPATT